MLNYKILKKNYLQNIYFNLIRTLELYTQHIYIYIYMTPRMGNLINKKFYTSIRNKLISNPIVRFSKYNSFQILLNDVKLTKCYFGVNSDSWIPLLHTTGDLANWLDET